MSFTTSPIQFTLVMASALVAAVVALLGVLRRGPWLTTLIFASPFLVDGRLPGRERSASFTPTPPTPRKSWAIYLARTLGAGRRGSGSP